MTSAFFFQRGGLAKPIQENRFIVDLVARGASAGGELTTGETLSRTPAVAGRTKLPRRERQTDGSAAGGHPHFFGNPIVFQGAPQPAIRLIPMRDLVNRPISRPQRERAACSRAYTLQDRASGVRGGWVRCASGVHRRRRMVGMRRGVLSKKRGWPLTASAPSAQPDVPHPNVQPETRKCLARLGGCRRTRAQRRPGAIARLACNQIHEAPENNPLRGEVQQHRLRHPPPRIRGRGCRIHHSRTILNSTRRFCWRPSSVSFGAVGADSP
jgi:hypothetical protein